MSSPWFGLVREDLLQAKRSRRQAERKWRNTNLTVFKDLYKKAKHHVTNVVLKAKKLYYNSKISSANCSKELYKITNNILARTKQLHLPTTYPLSSLPELFSDYFADKIMKIRNELDSHAVSALPAQTDSFSGITLSTCEPVTEAMVTLVITKSGPKTCSLDTIPTALLLEILDCLLPSLTALINSSLSSGLFPQAFKSAVIFPLLKKPSIDPNELKNFRPISNLPFISKIIEKLVLVQISRPLSANNLLNQFQSAYRPGHSTETALLKIVNDLLLSLDDGEISLLASLDLSAAFDTIDHDIILHILQHDFGLSGVKSSIGFHQTFLVESNRSLFTRIHMCQHWYLVAVVMLPVDTTMAVMCHVLVVCCKLFHGSGCRCGYCRFARSVDTCRRPVMLLLSHSELHADELAWWQSSLSESYHIS